MTTIEGLLANDSALSTSERPYYTTGNGTSYSAPQVAGVIALMLEANPNLTPAQIRDILQRTATPLPPYYMYEVGAGMLNAQAAVLEAAFPQRHFGAWRGTAYQGQVGFTTSAPQSFTGSVTPGTSSDTSLNIPADTLLASVEVAWGDTQSLANLNLSMIDPQGTNLGTRNLTNFSGLTGRRQRAILQSPGAGNWKARIQGLLPVSVPASSVTNLLGTTLTQSASQGYNGVLRLTKARYATLSDTGGLDPASLAGIYQSFRMLTMSPIALASGRRLRSPGQFSRGLVQGGESRNICPRNLVTPTFVTERRCCS